MWNIQRMSFYVENVHLHNNFFMRVLAYTLKWCKPVQELPNGSAVRALTDRHTEPILYLQPQVIYYFGRFPYTSQ